MPSTLKVTSTLTVTNTYDSGSGSLRYEIDQAHSGDTIVFNFDTKTDKKANSTPHTIMLTSGELDINKNLTIQGPGAGLLTITSQPFVNGAFVSENGSRIFEVDGAGTTVAISGLTMTDGGGTASADGFPDYSPYAGYGGAILNFGRLTIGGCSFGSGFDGSGGSSAQFGGGAIANFGTMQVTGCGLFYNQTWGSGVGGGIYNAGTLTVSGCTLAGNSTNTAGGGIYNAGSAAALTVLDSIFSGNKPDNIYGAYTDGGGNTFN